MPDKARVSALSPAGWLVSLQEQLYFRLEFAAAKRGNYRGLDIYCSWVLKDAPFLLSKIATALDLIASSDVRTFDRMLTDLPRYLVLPGRAARFWCFTNTCELGAALLRSYPVPHIAAVIVHEATHARIRRRGLDTIDPERVERVCIKSEIQFLNRLQRDGQDVEEWIQIRRDLLAGHSGPLVRKESWKQRLLRECRGNEDMPEWFTSLVERLPGK